MCPASSSLGPHGIVESRVLHACGSRENASNDSVARRGKLVEEPSQSGGQFAQAAFAIGRPSYSLALHVVRDRILCECRECADAQRRVPPELARLRRVKQRSCGCSIVVRRSITGPRCREPACGVAPGAESCGLV